MGLWSFRLALGLTLCLAGGVITVIAQDTTAGNSSTAAAPTPEQIAAGKRVWNDAACFNCHGTSGQGGHSTDFPAGPSITTSALDPATMLEVIACGVPGTQMPGWAKGAYTERPCFGSEPGPVPADTRVIGVYDDEQLNNLMDFITATFRKKSHQ